MGATIQSIGVTVLVFLNAATARADVAFTSVVGLQRFSGGSSMYQLLGNGAVVGQGQSSAPGLYLVKDTFIAIDLSSVAAPITSMTISGVFSNFQAATSFGIVEGYANLSVTPGAFNSAGTDVASLFAAYHSSTFQTILGGSFTVDNGIPDMSASPFHYPLVGGAFSVSLTPAAVALAEADRLAGRTFWIGLEGRGFSTLFGGENVQADLVGLTITVPEPGSLPLAAIGGLIGLGYARRKGPST